MLPKLLFFSVILFIKPITEKIIIIEDTALKIPITTPMIRPFAEIEFINVLYKENNVRQVVPIVITDEGTVPKYISAAPSPCRLVKIVIPIVGHKISPKVIHKSP